MATSSKQISRKKKTFSGFFVAFLKSTWNLEYFEKKYQSHSLSVTEIINSKTGSHLKYPESHLSCKASAENMLRGPKDC